MKILTLVPTLLVIFHISPPKIRLVCLKIVSYSCSQFTHLENILIFSLKVSFFDKLN